MSQRVQGTETQDTVERVRVKPSNILSLTQGGDPAKLIKMKLKTMQNPKEKQIPRAKAINLIFVKLE